MQVWGFIGRPIPNLGAAFNIATHSQPVVLTPQTAHSGGQVQLPLA